MLSLTDVNDMRSALDQPLDTYLKKLLADRLSDTIHCGLEEYTHVIIIQEGDTETAVEAAIGFNPLSSRIDGLKHVADFDWLERHDHYWEMLRCVGNSGFAYIFLIEDADSSPFAAFCRAQSS